MWRKKRKTKKYADNEMFIALYISASACTCMSVGRYANFFQECLVSEVSDFVDSL